MQYIDTSVLMKYKEDGTLPQELQRGAAITHATAVDFIYALQAAEKEEPCVIAAEVRGTFRKLTAEQTVRIHVPPEFWHALNMMINKNCSYAVGAVLYASDNNKDIVTIDSCTYDIKQVPDQDFLAMLSSGKLNPACASVILMRHQELKSKDDIYDAREALLSEEVL